MDKIYIKGLEIFAKHGVHPEENVLGQKFRVNVEASVDTELAGLTDELSYSVSYSDMAKQAAASMTKEVYKLIERAAEVTALDLLEKFPLVREVSVEIEKPWAPVGLPLDRVSVKITRGWHRVFAAMGSNLGDSQGFLDQAKAAMEKHPRIRRVRESGRIMTKPYGVTDQPDFLNSVVELETSLSPLGLLHFLQELEQEAHRERKIHWGPRTLDLDVLFYDDLVMDGKELNVPHPEMTKRTFVLDPMCELAPYFVHPVCRKTMLEMRDELERK